MMAKKLYISYACKLEEMKDVQNYMFGLVIVSHSAKLAEAARELAMEGAPENVCIAAVGGVDNASCDPQKIRNAIQSVWGEGGVILIADIGSSITSVEEALLTIPKKQRGSIHLCRTPLIEGSLIAASLIAAGAPLEIILNESVHAKEKYKVPIADGSNASQAVHRLKESLPYKDTHSQIEGISLYPGHALGPIRHCVELSSSEIATFSEVPHKEWEVFARALATGKEHLQRLSEQEQLSMEMKEILRTQVLYLEDPILLQNVGIKIFNEKLSAFWAWCGAIEPFIQFLEAVEDSYISARAGDLKGLKRLISRLLASKKRKQFSLDSPVIVIAQDLDPFEMLEFRHHNVIGICLVMDNPFSHAAIIARSLGIPALCTPSLEALEIPDHTPILLDACAGKIHLYPTEKMTEEFLEKEKQSRKKRIQKVKKVLSPLETMDGKKVPLYANAYSLEGAEAAKFYGAEGIGLLRTELLFAHRNLSEELQRDTYKQFGDILESRTIRIRTFDFSGDKSRTLEGRQGVLTHLKIQLRAILCANPKACFEILIPMVTSLVEIRRVKMLIHEITQECEERGVFVKGNISLGMMLEVPSAGLMVDHFAKEVNFFNIGTNDLCQFLFAHPRNMPLRSKEEHLLDPALLRFMVPIFRCAKENSIPTMLCGEGIHCPKVLLLYIALGASACSVDPVFMPHLHEQISRFQFKHFKNSIKDIMNLENAEQVEEMLTV